MNAVKIWGKSSALVDWPRIWRFLKDFWARAHQFLPLTEYLRAKGGTLSASPRQGPPPLSVMFDPHAHFPGQGRQI